ncbi:MAG TPA: arylamine N-acetyltransferase [Bacteroidota bacterium]|nr:arylamine N-acetyltransferase [Bacteroidota bacterium]
MDAAAIDRYLRLLNVPAGKPTLDLLRKIVRAHLKRVPFENISKLWYARTPGYAGLPGVDRFLEGIGQYGFGGTCYSNNHYLNLLLAALGFDARLCGADMSRPDVHVVTMVKLPEGEFLVDGGYAAPFLEPLPLFSAGPVDVSLGYERYVLHPRDARGRSRLDLFRDGALKHGYTAKPEARDIAEFTGVIGDSFRPEATFMNAVVVTRFEDDRSLVLHNRTLIESRGTVSTRRELSGRSDVIAALEERFGMPSRISDAALPDMKRLDDPWA